MLRYDNHANECADNDDNDCDDDDDDRDDDDDDDDDGNSGKSKVILYSPCTRARPHTGPRPPVHTWGNMNFAVWSKIIHFLEIIQ